jgi:hypothetical protein
MDEAFEICRGQPSEVLHRIVKERLGEEDAGVVYESIDRPEPTDCGFCHPDCRFRIADIAVDQRQLT